MIKYSCPKCNEPMQAADDKVGSVTACPRCQAPVQVPAVKSNTQLILGIVGGALLLSCCVCGVIGALIVPQIIGQNANSAFGTVGASIGSTVTGT
jgi:hypothetical protein